MNLWVTAGLSIGAITILVLLITSITKNKNNIYLALSALSIWYLLLITYLFQTGDVLKYPHVLRTGNLFAFTIYPFLYLFAVNSFYPPGKWRPVYWLIFLPAIFYVIDMLPFLLLPAAEKAAIMKPLVSDRSQRIKVDQGWIGIPYWHAVMRYLWSALLAVLIVRLLHRNRYLNRSDNRLTNRVLFSLIGALLLVYLPLLLIGIISIFKPGTGSGFNTALIFMPATLIGLGLVIQLFPGMLYGFAPRQVRMPLIPLAPAHANADIRYPEKEPLPDFEATELPDEVSASNDVDDAALQQMSDQLDTVLRQNKSFKQQAYSIHSLANDSGIPAYQISWVINRYLGKNFNSFINGYRVAYFVHACRLPENANLTLEAMANQAGFASRSTFINAFKKEMGITPSHFMRQLKQNSDSN